LVKKLTENFEKLKGKRKTNTPGTPRTVQVRPEKENVVGKEEHKEFRSGVGSLLYLLKHSRPELSNPIRELSRCMSGPGKDNIEEMYRVIKWVMDRPNIGLKIKPKITRNEAGEIE
jgi:hypothetical protein